MRPDETCTQAGEEKPVGRSDSACPYYDAGLELDCQIFQDVVEYHLQGGKTPQDLINDGKYTRDVLWRFFLYCLKFQCANPEVECNQCGDCCKMWPIKDYRTDPSKPCKPEANNPCLKLKKQGNKYVCQADPKPQDCIDYPTVGYNRHLGLFRQFLTGNMGLIMVGQGQYVKVQMTPNCVYDFERVP